jgi:hypothetical protein
MSVSLDLEKVQKEADKIAEKLSNEMNIKIHAHVIVTDKNEPVVGYFKMPSRLQKMYALDLAPQSLSQANDNILKACLITSHSDPRILDEKPENDAIYLTFNMYASTLVELYNLNIQKKN